MPKEKKLCFTIENDTLLITERYPESALKNDKKIIESLAECPSVNKLLNIPYGNHTEKTADDFETSEDISRNLRNNLIHLMKSNKSLTHDVIAFITGFSDSTIRKCLPYSTNSNSKDKTHHNIHHNIIIVFCFLFDLSGDDLFFGHFSDFMFSINSKKLNKKLNQLIQEKKSSSAGVEAKYLERKTSVALIHLLVSSIVCSVICVLPFLSFVVMIILSNLNLVEANLIFLLFVFSITLLAVACLIYGGGYCFTNYNKAKEEATQEGLFDISAHWLYIDRFLLFFDAKLKKQYRSEIFDIIKRWKKHEK